MRFNTRLIHDGQPADPLTGAVNVPVYLSSTFRQAAPNRNQGYVYGRSGNPTRAVLEATLAKLEGEFKKLADATGMNIQLRRTEERAARNDMLPYSIDVVCLDQTGIVAGLSGFFSQRGVDIAELSTRSYAAAHTGAPMFSVQMIVNVPSRLHIGVLREEFMDFCDHLNLDAIFEPVKS